MAVVTIACGHCGREFQVEEDDARRASPQAYAEPSLAVPEHQDSAGIRCAGSTLPGELRAAS
jgi:hypothetical protein